MPLSSFCAPFSCAIVNRFPALTSVYPGGFAAPLPQNFNLVVDQTDNRGWFSKQDTSVHHHIQHLAQGFLDLDRIVKGLLPGYVGAGCYQWMPQFPNNVHGDSVVGDPDSNGLLFGRQEVWNDPGRLENKSVRSGKVAFHDFEDEVADLPVIGCIGQVGANEGKRLSRVALLYLVNLSNPLFIKDIASDAVGGIRRIGNDPALFEAVHDPQDMPLLGIFRIDGHDHRRLHSMSDHPPLCTEQDRELNMYNLTTQINSNEFHTRRIAIFPLAKARKNQRRYFNPFTRRRAA
jgi:hypothetical protein